MHCKMFSIYNETKMAVLEVSTYLFLLKFIIIIFYILNNVFNYASFQFHGILLKIFTVFNENIYSQKYFLLFSILIFLIRFFTNYLKWEVFILRISALCFTRFQPLQFFGSTEPFLLLTKFSLNNEHYGAGQSPKPTTLPKVNLFFHWFGYGNNSDASFQNKKI